MTTDLVSDDIYVLKRRHNILTRWLPPAIIVAASLILSVPFLQHGLPFAHDSEEHLERYVNFVAQISQGELYPRWLAKFNGGLGSPVMFVYAPLAYYVPAALRPFLHFPMDGIRESREVGVSMWLALALSGLAAYVWLKSFVQRNAAATFGALLYMAMPYHLVVDLYTRAAVAEVWAFVWMPLILLFASQTVQTRSASAVAKFAVSYALLIYTHLLTTLIFTPVVIVAPLLLAKRGEFRSALWRVGLAMTLGIGLSAAYLGPALLHAHYVSPSRLSELRPNLSYPNNFLAVRRAWAPPGGRGDFLWKVSWLALSSLAVACAAFMLSKDRSKKESSFWIVVATISVAMMFSPSRFLWSSIPPLAALQFPYRFGTILTVATVALLALAADSIKVPWRASRVAFAAAATAGILVWTLSDMKAILNFSPWALSSAQPLSMQPMVLDVLLPGWSQASDSQYLTGLGIRKLSQQQVSLDRPSAREIQLTADGRGGWLAVPLLDYHGWIATTEDGQKLPMRAAPTGLLEVEAPSGHTRIRLSLPEDWMERTALAATIGCALLTLILLAVGRARPAPARKPEAAHSVPG